MLIVFSLMSDSLVLDLKKIKDSKQMQSHEVFVLYSHLKMYECHCIK